MDEEHEQGEGGPHTGRGARLAKKESKSYAEEDDDEADQLNNEDMEAVLELVAEIKVVKAIDHLLPQAAKNYCSSRR